MAAPTDPRVLEAIDEAYVAEVREATRRAIRRYRGQLPPPDPDTYARTHQAHPLTDRIEAASRS